jgi:uncharacterized UPF0160 family protein
MGGVASNMVVEDRSLGTHNGTFHADEVTACALLILYGLVDRNRVYRSRDQELLQRCEFVCDVGGIYDSSIKRFDHHQSDYKGPLSSAGMILRYLEASGTITPEVMQMFDRSLIHGVDLHDNGLAPYMSGCATFSQVVSNFNPISYIAPDSERDEAFFQAVDFVHRHLKHSLARYEYVLSCREAVNESMKADQVCLKFSEGLPWLESFFDLGGVDHPARFVLMPSGEHWKLRGIPPSLDDRMSVRQPLPKEWAGKLEGELREATGIPGAIFCHKGRFISVWETREDALMALSRIVKK